MMTESHIRYHDDTVHGQKFHPQSVFPDFPLETVVSAFHAYSRFS